MKDGSSVALLALAAMVAGAANGAAWSLGPVYALGIGMRPSSVPLFMTSICSAVWRS